MCRLRGDPILDQYKAGKFILLEKQKEYVLTEKKQGDCRFKVEVLVGSYGQAGLVVPKWMMVTMDEGKVVVQLLENHRVKFIVPGSWGTVDVGSGYSEDITDNVSVYRNGDFVVVEDKECDIRVGYDSEGGLNSVATIVVANDLGPYLDGKCGTCGQ